RLWEPRPSSECCGRSPNSLKRGESCLPPGNEFETCSPQCQFCEPSRAPSDLRFRAEAFVDNRGITVLYFSLISRSGGICTTRYSGCPSKPPEITGRRSNVAIAPEQLGIGIRRHFTTAGVDPYSSVSWEKRDARISNWKTGEVAFEQLGVEVPSTWSL